METDLIRKITQAVEDSFDKQIALTQKLVSIPSQMREEKDAQNFIAKELEDRGYSVDRWELDEEKLKTHEGFSPVPGGYKDCWNVVATHTPKKEMGKSLILNGHIDVVPVGPLNQWSRDPYDTSIEGDWLYGRGSADMKAGLMANICALDALRSIGLQPSSTVYIQSVVEEECTGNGALACLVKGYEADAVIIPEPIGEKLARAACGVLWFKVSVEGKPSHSGMSEEGVDAIKCVMGIVDALRVLEERWNLKKKDQPYFKDMDHPVNLTVGKINGGDWPSAVPASCEMECRINIFPGEDVNQCAEEIVACINDYAASHSGLKDHPPEVSFIGHFSSGVEIEPNSEPEKVLSWAHSEIVKSELESIAVPLYLDAIVFTLYGDMTTLVYGPAGKGMHSFDECVSLSSLKRVTKTIALFIAQWCGVEDI